ncbi:MAG: hypothetical protein OXH68_17025 [Gammaproteobacteria bacterium]|nr:hypothetical protein [Gammaproteobacteria bacterium]
MAWSNLLSGVRDAIYAQVDFSRLAPHATEPYSTVALTGEDWLWLQSHLRRAVTFHADLWGIRLRDEGGLDPLEPLLFIRSGAASLRPWRSDNPPDAGDPIVRSRALTTIAVLQDDPDCVLEALTLGDGDSRGVDLLRNRRFAPGDDANNPTGPWFRYSGVDGATFRAEYQRTTPLAASAGRTVDSIVSYAHHYYPRP